MKFIFSFLAIIFSITQVYGQRNEIPEVAFIIDKKVIKIDSLTFKKLLVIDTMQNPNHEKIYCSNFSDLFHLPSSYMSLLFYLNSSFAILNNKATPVLVPSKKLCTEYINLKIKAGEYQYIEGLNSDYIISDDIKFDIILFPSLRDTLNKLSKEIIDFSKKEKEKETFLSNFDSDKSKLEFIKTEINLSFKINEPYSKGSLKVMISMLKNIIAQQNLNNKTKKEIKINNLERFNDIFFAINNKAINSNINDIPLIFNLVDSLNQHSHFERIYYCPIWDTLDISEITFNANPLKSILPICDYYFWGSNDGIKKFPNSLPKAYKIRWQSLDAFQKITLKSN
jgi:hypothetical protein